MFQDLLDQRKRVRAAIRPGIKELMRHFVGRESVTVPTICLEQRSIFSLPPAQSPAFHGIISKYCGSGVLKSKNCLPNPYSDLLRLQSAMWCRLCQAASLSGGLRQRFRARLAKSSMRNSSSGLMCRTSWVPSEKAGKRVLMNWMKKASSLRGRLGAWLEKEADVATNKKSSGKASNDS